MASEATRSSRAADSYIGSLISLTSKFEIRYEGFLYNINTEESSIGLRNVKSFGTEGRKKDGPQVPQSDKVYEYILFRGSDIKDLQVKSSPPVQTQQPIHNDPAIIQSHYSQPATVSSSVPSASGGPITDPSSHTLQMGLSRSTFQGGVPLYQPEGSLGSWGSSPAPSSSANGGGLAMPPIYWQGFYGPSSGLSYVQQQPLLQSTPGLSTPQMVQQPTQYPGNAPVPIGSSNMPALNMPTSKLLSSTLPEFPPPLLPPVSSGSMNLTFGNLSSNMLSSMVPSKPTAISSETSLGLMPNVVPTSIPLSTSVSPSFPLVSQLTTSSSDVNAIVPPVSKPKTVPGMSSPYKTMPQSVSTNLGISSSHQSETSTTSLVTPDQLLQSGPTALSSSGPLKSASKDSEVVSESSSEPPLLASKDTHEPILPLPSLPNHKMNGAPLHIHRGYDNRGRGRGQGNGILHPVTKFTEDFDFIAMNEKFKKDEVWGHLGKPNKMRNNNGNGEEDDGEDFQDEDVNVSESLNYDKKPVYVKDDFFDSLSCNALDCSQRSGRARFSEQMKIDTETFGDFPRYRAGGRGGRGQGRGGRSKGSYHGRGYAYVGRGRGQNH